MSRKDLKIFILCLFLSLVSGCFLCAENYWPLGTHDCYESCKCACEEEFTALPPLFEQIHNDCGCKTVLRPLGMHKENYETCEKEDYFLYPLMSHKRSPTSHRWNIFNLIHGGYDCTGDPNCPKESKLTVFPLFFRKKTCDPCTSYWGVFPIYGSVHNYFGAEKIHWALFPGYLGVERSGGSVRHGLPWPFIRWQTGPCAGGFGIWPLYGHFYQAGNHDSRYMLWPLFYRHVDQYNHCIPRVRHGFLPFYTYEHSSRKTATHVIWPFFGHIRRNDKVYCENQYFWPFFVQGRGEDMLVNRWAPFWTHSVVKGVDKKWLLWPTLRVKRWCERGMYIVDESLFIILFNRQRQWCCKDQCWGPAEKSHLWPLYSYWSNGCGCKQFQALSPLEVFFPNNQAVREIYSPFFAIFRAEQVRPGHARQSVLFNMIRAEKWQGGQKFSFAFVFDYKRKGANRKVELLKGLLGYECCNGRRHFKFLWLRI
jgi:hypothetical protein